MSHELAAYSPDAIRPSHNPELTDAVSQMLSRVDITCIYGQHSTPEDASATLAHIVPGSVVFLEGIYTDLERKKDSISGAHNELLITHGVDDLRYRTHKRRTVADLQGKLRNAKDFEHSNRDFLRHSITMISGLIQKDCVIMYADYDRTIVGESEGTNRFMEANSAFTAPILPVLLTGSMPLHKRIQNLEHRATAMLYAQMIRDDIVPVMMAAHTSSLFAAHAMEKRAIGKEDKPQVYLTFGTAHAKSQQSRFNALNISPDIIETHTLSPHEYIPTWEQIGQYVRDIPGHTSQLAVEGLFHFFCSDKTDAKALAIESYDTLLQTIRTKDDMRAFVLQSLGVWDSIKNRSPNIAGNYLSLLRGYMPNPERFAGLPLVMPSDYEDLAASFDQAAA